MTSHVDRLIQMADRVSSDQSVPEYALDMLLEELNCRIGQSDTEDHSAGTKSLGGSEEELLIECLAQLGRPQIRYRLRLLEHLAWTVSIDPVRYAKGNSNHHTDLLYREFQVTEEKGDRVVRRNAVERPAIIGGAHVGGQGLALYFPTAPDKDYSAGSDRLRDLPAGTVVHHAFEDEELGTVGSSLIAEDDITVSRGQTGQR